MKTILNFESNQKSPIIIGFFLIVVIGLLDYLTGYEYAFSVFYVLPISLITWYSTQKIWLAACVASAIVWLWADISTAHPYSKFLIPYWNTLIRFSFFVIIAYLLSALKSALQREKDLSLTDHLTGASNSRRFYEIVQMEISRLERSQRSFTIAYLDVDNFKTINDTFGHGKGDLVLKTIVNSLKSKLRKTDLVARLGGDELALFFPDTNQEAAEIILPKIQEVLMNEMAKNNWGVTFSIGVVTCTVAPPAVDELIKIADDLMYSVKRHGKNMVKYSVYEAESLAKQKTG
jgi:diguanylate cyclase (GGDEF)-like protein